MSCAISSLRLCVKNPADVHGRGIGDGVGVRFAGLKSSCLST